MISEQDNCVLDEYADLVYDYSGVSPAQYDIKGTFLRALAGAVITIYALVTFTLDVGEGYYIYKIPVMLVSLLLLLSPPSYPFLLGYLISINYVIKSHQFALPEQNYMAEFTTLIIIMMAFCTGFLQLFDANKRNPYQKFDFGSLCLFGIMLFVLAGYLGSQNRYLFFRRFLEILAFCSAFYLGRSYINVKQGLKYLVSGLALGILAFHFPRTIGLVLREGAGILRHLAGFRSMMVTSASDSGIMLVAFVVAYTVSVINVFPRKSRQFALWFAVIPAVVVIMFYLSRTAIMLIPISFTMCLLFSGKRRTAILVTLFLLLLVTAAYFKVQMVQELFQNFFERLLTISAGSETREQIRVQALEFGVTNILWGIGAGQYRLYSGYFVEAHNEMLNMLVEHGMISLLLYLCFWIYLVHKAIRLRLSRNPVFRNLAMIFLVLLPIYFVEIQRGSMYFKRGGILFAFCVGFLVTLYYQSKEEDVFSN